MVCRFGNQRLAYIESNRGGAQYHPPYHTSNYLNCTNMKKLRSILLCIVGVISIGLAIKSYSTKESRYEYNSAYGGDAFTGIQNAAARTSKNVSELKESVDFGFGSVLLITGLSLLVFGVTSFGSEKCNQTVSA